MQQILASVGIIIAGVFACTSYFYLSNKILDWIYPPCGAHISQNINRANAIRPWLFLLPAVSFLGVYLVYPIVNSAIMSFMDAGGMRFVGFRNYQWLANDAKFRESIRNNAMWLVVVPAASTLFGLVIAALTDRIAWGNAARSLIFMPMAISFVGAAVIWKFVYAYNGQGVEQIGILNSVLVFFGGKALPFITIPLWNNVFLMVILIWIQTGFAMVILAAALRGIPHETIEAALLDGANPLQIFWKIKIPQIWGTIAVVWTTITILVLKIFDIVLAMTNGQWGTQVLANLMFDWMFRGSDAGRASTIALVIMVLVIPIMIWNMRRSVRSM